MNRATLCISFTELTSPVGTSTIKLLTECSLTKGQRPHLQAAVQIDGEAIGAIHTLDWHELFRTLRGPGEFLIWTAPSGEPLEAGIEDCCIATHEGDQIAWEWGHPISLIGLAHDQPREFRTARFDLKQYETALWQGWWAACSLVRANGLMTVNPMPFGQAGLLGLDRWFKTDDAMPFAPTYVPYSG